MAHQSSRFVPNVLRQILSFVHPADQEVCTITQWQLREIAKEELHYRLAVPKYGMLLLELPSSFHGRVHKAPCYNELIRTNVEAPKQSKKHVTEQMKIFLAGHETLLLSEFGSSVHLYAELTTLVINLGEKQRDLNPHYPYTLLHSKYASSRGQPKSEMTLAWHRWAQMIAAVMDQCTASLLHLVFVDAMGNSEECENFVPREFYAALKVDEQLAEMRNLQTLYLPTLGKLEQAFDKPFPTTAWKALHDIALAERLPSLRRAVFSDQDFNSKRNFPFNDDPHEPIVTCGLPVIAARGVLVQISAAADHESLSDSSYLSVIFPEARIVKKRQWSSTAVEIVRDFEERSFEDTCYYVEEYSTTKCFLENIALSVQNFMAEKAAELGVLYHVRSVKSRRSLPEGVKINVSVDAKSKLNDTLTSLFNDDAPQYIVHPYRVVLEFSYDYDEFESLQVLLPLFTKAWRNNFALSAKAVNMTKFKIALLENQNSLDLMLDEMGEGSSEYNRIFQLPKIALCFTIELWSGISFDGDDGVVLFDFGTWATAIETQMENELYQIVHDATKAWIFGHDLKLGIYQKVVRLDYYFSFRPPKRSHVILGEFGSPTFKKFERFFTARQEKFQRRMWSEMFAPLALLTQSCYDSLDKDEDILGRTVARIKRSLPLPELKKLRIAFSFVEQSDRDSD